MPRSDSRERKPRAGFRHVGELVVAFLAVFFFKDAATRALSRTFPDAGWTSLAGVLLPAALGWAVGMLVRSVVSARGERAVATHPDEPWLWNREWARGRIAHSNRVAAVAIALMAVVTDLFALAVARILLERFSVGLLFGSLLFLVAAAAVTGVAVMIVRGQLAFGTSELRLETIPGIVGGEFAGTVEVRFPGAESKQEFRVSLACSTDRKDVWEKESVVASDAWRQKGERVEVPFRFEIPAELPSSSDDASGASWQVNVAADTPRGSYQSKFSVPIFRTWKSREPEPAPASEHAATAATHTPTGGPQRAFRFTAGIALLLLFSAGPLFAMVLGGYFFKDWLGSRREDLGRIGKRVTTERRDCQFFYTWTRSSTTFEERTFYVYPVGEKYYACQADPDFAQRDDRGGTCPCLSLRDAEKNKISSTRCEEHVEVLYDPVKPTDCRPANTIGQRSPGAKGELLLAFVCFAGGGAGFVQILRAALRK